MPVFQYMYMDWKMVIAIKHESKAKEDKKRRHTFFGQIYESYSIPTKEKNNFIEKQARLL